MIAAAEVAPADFNGPVEEVAGRRPGLLELVMNASEDALVDAGHGDDHRRADRLEIVGQKQDRAVVGDGAARGKREIVACRSLERVRKRQKGEEDVAHLREDALERGLHVAHDVAVREHDALGAARGARRVDDAREVVLLRAFRQLDDVRACGKPLGEASDHAGLVVDLVFGDDHGRQVLKVAACGLDLLPARQLVRDEDLRPAVGKNEGAGARRVDSVQGHGNEAVGQSRLIGAGMVDAVGHQDADAGAALKVHGGVGSAPLHDADHQLGVAQAVPAFGFLVELSEGLPLAVSLHAVDQKLGERGEVLKARLGRRLFGHDGFLLMDGLSGEV